MLSGDVCRGHLLNLTYVMSKNVMVLIISQASGQRTEIADERDQSGTDLLESRMVGVDTVFAAIPRH